MIYLITNRVEDCCKIGYSNNPEIRLTQLQTANKSELELETVIDGTMQDEKKLHKLFSAKSLHGEWFKFSDSICKYFNVERYIVRVYPDVLGLLDELDKVSIKVLTHCSLICTPNTNMVALTLPFIQQIAKSSKLSVQTIRNSIVKLSKKNALIPMGSATYRINPRYYWKGNSSERKKTMEYILRIECPSC